VKKAAKSKLVLSTFEVTGETDPCPRMDDAAPGLKDAMIPDWRGGVTCRVIESGHLSVGNAVTFKIPESKHIHMTDPAPDMTEKAGKSPQSAGVPGQGV
jgi:MOSC domain-containing protein YiiM